MRKMFAAAFLWALLISVAPAGPSLPVAAQENHTQTPAPSVRPADPPGETSPLVGVLAGVAVLVAGAAGIFIYRLIREGL